MTLLLLLLINSLIGQYNYSLEDFNSTSNNYENFVGPSYFENEITMHYFGSFTWGLCNSRFAQLNSVYENLLSNGYDQVNLIGIGYSYQSSSLNNWSNSSQNSSVCYDYTNNPTFSNWGASQRDFYLLDHNGNLVLEQNISSGLPNNLESIVIELINDIPTTPECNNGDEIIINPCNPQQCIDGNWYEVIIDCQEQTGVPCPNGIYVEPSADECCSVCRLYGDMNSDNSIDVSDLVSVINLIINNDYNALADVNEDGSLDVTDVVTLINIIIS